MRSMMGCGMRTMHAWCKIHAGYGGTYLCTLGLKGLYRCHHRVCSAPIIIRPPICSLCCSGSSPAPWSLQLLQLLHLLLCHGHPEGGGEGGGGEGDGDRATAKRTTHKPAKKQKGGKGAAVAAVEPIRHLPRQARQLPRRPSRPSA